MQKSNVSLKVTSTELLIGVAIVVTMLVCHVASLVGIQIQTLAACTGAVMCVQETGKASWGAGVNRVLGVICGGVAGILVVLLDNTIGNEYVFFLLCGAGVIANLLLCKVVKLPLVQARVSCMSLLLVVLVLQGSARINYALGRFFGTLCGAVVAVLVSMLWAKLFTKKQASVQ